MTTRVLRRRFTVNEYHRIGEAGIFVGSLEDYRRPLAQGYYDVRSPRRGEQVTLEALPGLNLIVDDILG